MAKKVIQAGTGGLGKGPDESQRIHAPGHEPIDDVVAPHSDSMFDHMHGSKSLDPPLLRYIRDEDTEETVGPRPSARYHPDEPYFGLNLRREERIALYRAVTRISRWLRNAGVSVERSDIERQFLADAKAYKDANPEASVASCIEAALTLRKPDPLPR